MCLVGVSAQHVALLSFLKKIASSRVEVFIIGPTGVGKELYARFIHENSECEGEFVPVNCGAVPAPLFENELFGHVSGAFTGARVQHEGVVAAAEGGTLFLDEIDSLSLENQAKLLRFLQEREYRRLGESRVHKANTRVVAATNVDPVQLVDCGTFRSDLYYRLRVVPVVIPPLRERLDDLIPLVEAFADRYAALYKQPRLQFSPEVTAWFRAYSWPGNVRELENCVRYLTAMNLGRAVSVEDVSCLRNERPVTPKPQAVMRLDLTFQKAKRALVDEFERQYISNALRRSQGNISRAAQASGKARRAFFELMRKHGIGTNQDLAQPALSPVPLASMDTGAARGRDPNRTSAGQSNSKEGKIQYAGE